MRKIFIACILFWVLGFNWVYGQQTIMEAKPMVKVIKLGPNVNSAYEELAPVISGDGQTLFFVRAGHPQNIGGIDAGQDVWMSKRIDDTTWTRAVQLPWPINNISHNVICGTNYDGTEIYLSNVYDPQDAQFPGKIDVRMSPGISFSTYDANTNRWSYPQEIPVDGLDKLNRNSHFFFHWVDSTKRQLLISKHIDKPGARSKDSNEEDIFLYEKDSEDGKYKLVTSLGDSINTDLYETAPFLSADKKTLYFTRHSEVGFSGNDWGVDAHIYFTTRSSIDSWTNWENPRLLYKGFEEAKGSIPGGLNSEHFDAYLHLHDKIYHRGDENLEVFDYGFFVSARPDESNPERSRPADIYEFIVLDANYRLIVRTFGVDRYDEDTTELPARVLLQGPKDTLDSPDESVATRDYAFKNDQIGDITIFVTKPGYRGDTVTLSIGDEDYFTEQDVYLERAYTTRREVLSGVLFAYAKNNLQASEVAKLDKLVKYMTVNQNMEVSLGGYTDFHGTYASNVALSRRRVSQVKDYLMSKGISESRIHIHFYSEDKPLADDQNNTQSDEARRRSRRVVIEEVNENMKSNEIEKYKNYQNQDIAVQYLQKTGA